MQDAGGPHFRSRCDRLGCPQSGLTRFFSGPFSDHVVPTSVGPHAHNQLGMWVCYFGLVMLMSLVASWLKNYAILSATSHSRTQLQTDLSLFYLLGSSGNPTGNAQVAAVLEPFWMNMCVLLEPKVALSLSQLQLDRGDTIRVLKLGLQSEPWNSRGVQIWPHQMRIEWKQQ